jgi:D-alanyl-D-alanine endopeptidase (penicillin-binding protein 7)
VYALTKLILTLVFLGVSTFSLPESASAQASAPSASEPAPTARTARISSKPSTVKSRSALQVRVSVRLDANSRVAQKRRMARSSRNAAPERLSMGEMAGLQSTPDELALKSRVALVVDQDTEEVLFSKNPQAILPIASITKLMTAVVVMEAHLPLEESLTVSQEDVDTEKGSSSRLRVGTQLTREEMLHLALMSSENRAAHALGRNYPGGLSAFVQAMNAKAQLLGMSDTHYVEPTGLSSQNQSSARDLATLVKVAHTNPLIRELSTSPAYQVEVGNRQLQFHNTNRLVSSPSWDIGLQKTGYISEAGRCLVMQASMAGRKLIMIFLDSSGRNSRLADAERVRRWITDLAPKSTS